MNSCIHGQWEGGWVCSMLTLVGQASVWGLSYSWVRLDSWRHGCIQHDPGSPVKNIILGIMDTGRPLDRAAESQWFVYLLGQDVKITSWLSIRGRLTVSVRTQQFSYLGFQFCCCNFVWMQILNHYFIKNKSVSLAIRNIVQKTT